MTLISYSSSTASSADTWTKLTDLLITLKVTKITNPASMQPTPSVIVTTFTNTDNKIQTSSDLKVALTTTGTLTSAGVTRTEPAVLNQETVLTFTLTLSTKLYNTNSYIKLEIPRQ